MEQYCTVHQVLVADRVLHEDLHRYLWSAQGRACQWREPTGGERRLCTYPTRGGAHGDYQCDDECGVRE